MNENPCISIIVPVYKVESVLSRCVDSILCQSFRDFELLLIDDGSPDNSGTICDKYAHIDKRVRAIHQKNGGVSIARNRGIREAKGEYLVFIDSDDWVQSDYFSSLQPYLGKYDIIFGGLDIVNQEGCSIDKILPPHFSSETNSFSDVIYSLFKINLLGYVISTVVRRKIVVDQSIYFKEGVSLHEDSLFCYEYCMFAETFYSLDKAMYKYVRYDIILRKTLSCITPPNHLEVLQAKQDKITLLLQHVQMPVEKARFILGRLNYEYCRISIDIACRRKDWLFALRSVLLHFSMEKMTACTFKERILVFLVKTGNPYLIYVTKKIIFSIN